MILGRIKEKDKRPFGVVSWGHRSQASADRLVEGHGCRDSCPVRHRGSCCCLRESFPAEMGLGEHTLDQALGDLYPRDVLDLSSDLGHVNFLFWLQ